MHVGHQPLDRRVIIQTLLDRKQNVSKRNPLKRVRISFQFIVSNIDDVLINYEPGLPKNKPDVLEQTKQLEKARHEKMKKTDLKQLKHNIKYIF